MTTYSGANWSQDVLEEMLPVGPTVQDEHAWPDGDPGATEPLGPWTGEEVPHQPVPEIHQAPSEEPYVDPGFPVHADEPVDDGGWGSGAADGPGPSNPGDPVQPVEALPVNDSPVVEVLPVVEEIDLPEPPAPVESDIFEMPEEFHDAMAEMAEMDQLFAD